MGKESEIYKGKLNVWGERGNPCDIGGRSWDCGFAEVRLQGGRTLATESQSPSPAFRMLTHSTTGTPHGMCEMIPTLQTGRARNKEVR